MHLVFEVAAGGEENLRRNQPWSWGVEVKRGGVCSPHGSRRLGRGCDGAARECMRPHPANKWVDGSGVSRQDAADLVQMGRGCLRTGWIWTDVLPNALQGRGLSGGGGRGEEEKRGRRGGEGRGGGRRTGG